MQVDKTNESPMLKRVKKQNPDKEYPAAMGKNWTKDEEDRLLKALQDGLVPETIAQIHERTVGGIISRIKMLVLNMHKCGVSIDEIARQTNLDDLAVEDMITPTHVQNGKLTEEIKTLREQMNRIESKLDKIDTDLWQLKTRMSI